jgi:hypothetical protein
MREKSKKQLPLMHLAADHAQARELEAISRILDAEPTIAGLVHQDLCQGRELTATGANGMSAEQVLRAAIVKQMGSRHGVKSGSVTIKSLIEI